MNRNPNAYYILIFLSFIALASCEKEPSGSNGDLLAIPVGRSFLGASSIDVTISGMNYESDYMFDSCGGYWLCIPKTGLTTGDIIIVRFTRKIEESNLYYSVLSEKEDWIKPSHYIDSENELVASKAKELTEGLSTDIEKARKIQAYVIGHVSLKIYKDSFLDKASTTNELGYGTCMNFSRLFVALCRALNIPARSVWGIVNAHDDIGGYNNHHQWAEFQDESGFWHPADFGYTTSFNLNDIRYLDLIYAAEENTIIKNRKDYHIIFEDLQYPNDYPVTLDGKLSFRLIHDSRPDSMAVEYSYEFQ